MSSKVDVLGYTSSAEIAAGTTVIKASRGRLQGFLVETDGSNDVTIQIYNHASTATNPVTPSIVVPASDRYGGAVGMNVECPNGIVAVLSGIGSVATVYFR